MRVPGAQGPSGLCSLAERDETPGSPASASSPTYGWEKQNCSNGASRVEGAKGWMVGDGGCPQHPAAGSWELEHLLCPRLPLLSRARGLNRPHRCWGGRGGVGWDTPLGALWPPHAQPSPLAGPPTSPSTTSMGSQKSTESIAGSR